MLDLLTGSISLVNNDYHLGNFKSEQKPLLCYHKHEIQFGKLQICREKNYTIDIVTRCQTLILASEAFLINQTIFYMTIKRLKI